MMIKKYKSTSLGLIPENWDIKTVEELVKANILDKPLDGNHGERHPVSSDYVLSGIPFIMASDVKDFMLDFNNCKYIKKSQADTLLKGFSKEGDILLTHKATIGNVAFVKNIPSEYIMLTPQVTYYRVLDENKLSRKYLMYYFRTQVFQDLLKMWAGSGSTRAYIGITKQLKLPIILPPIEEQLKIVYQLDVYDKLIDNNNKRIVLLEKMSQEIYKEWFVRRRFPGYEKVNFNKGVPQGWIESKLGDCIDTLKGYAFKSNWFKDEGRAVVKVSDFTQDSISLEKVQFISEDRVNEFLKYCISTNDILIQTVGSWPNNPQSVVGKVIRVPSYANGALLNQNIVKIVEKGIDKHFLYYILKDEAFKGFIINCAQGAANQASITLDSIKKYNFMIPPYELQKRFGEIVSSKVNAINNLKQKNINLIKVRDLLLPRLMSGKISVE